jgi:hypothetical protein
MPDWFSHTLIGWITGKTTKIDIGLVVIGALLPDISKINLIFTWLEMKQTILFNPLHTPIGVVLLAGILALLFKDIKKAFLPLGIGVLTHFLLDFLLINTSGGMNLLFPFSWEEWQLQIIRSDDYRITILLTAIALIIFFLYFYYEKRKTKNKQQV